MRAVARHPRGEPRPQEALINHKAGQVSVLPSSAHLKSAFPSCLAVDEVYDSAARAPSVLSSVRHEARVTKLTTAREHPPNTHMRAIFSHRLM